MKHKQKLKVGDKVRNIHNNFEGVIINIWDGKYTCSYYNGEQFNPYRIMVRFGQDYIMKFGGGLCGDGTIMLKLEHLEHK